MSAPSLTSPLTSPLTRHSQRDPMDVFLLYRDVMLHEMIRHEGLKGTPADDRGFPACGRCTAEMGSIRCLDCYKPGVLCTACTVHEHRDHPLHRVQVCFILYNCSRIHMFCSLQETHVQERSFTIFPGAILPLHALLTAVEAKGILPLPQLKRESSPLCSKSDTYSIQSFPSRNFILQDLPEILPLTRSNISNKLPDALSTERIRLEQHDFFREQPRKGDDYSFVFRFVL